ncbi:hypothetical protein [Alicyclobacillus sendaiensis]|uniref:hypothetical protein n=1 Tax=Alicyclobacillus sendaiensis TaxID=192387 RepID=UPI0012ED12EB|nr:hypothetical protein [Alicyclobacillus sendaiensis]
MGSKKQGLAACDTLEEHMENLGVVAGGTGFAGTRHADGATPGQEISFAGVPGLGYNVCAFRRALQRRLRCARAGVHP